MTKTEAFNSMPDGYSQHELLAIWDGWEAEPINAIRALVDVDISQARQIWNARKNGIQEFEKYIEDVNNWAVVYNTA